MTFSILWLATMQQYLENILTNKCVHACQIRVGEGIIIIWKWKDFFMEHNLILNVQIEVFYKVDRLLNALLTLWVGHTVQLSSMRIPFLVDDKSFNSWKFCKIMTSSLCSIDCGDYAKNHPEHICVKCYIYIFSINLTTNK